MVTGGTTKVGKAGGKTQTFSAGKWKNMSRSSTKDQKRNQEFMGTKKATWRKTLFQIEQGKPGLQSLTWTVLQREKKGGNRRGPRVRLDRQIGTKG